MLLSVFLFFSLLEYQKIMLHPFGLILRLQYTEYIPAFKAALPASINFCTKDRRSTAVGVGSEAART